jgi:hypothetical protein
MVFQVFLFEEAARDILSYVFFTGHLEVEASSWIVPSSEKGYSAGMFDALPHEVRSGLGGGCWQLYLPREAVRCT